MNQLTFIDKIQVLIKLLFSSPIIIGIFAFSMALMIILFFYSKFNKKIIKFIFISIYVLVLGFTIFKYGNYFLTSIDSFVTIFMANIYFPMIPVYIFVMFISFIIMIITLSSKKKNKFIKIINTVFFTLIQMLFALFIYIVESNNIDLSNNTGIYTNEQTLTLLELGMGLFVIWIIVLLVILYLKKADKIFKVKDVVEHDDFDEYINDYNEPVIESVSESKSNKVKKKLFKKKDKPVKDFAFKENDNIIQNSNVDISNNFNNSVVDNLVPELSLFGFDNEEIISFEDDFGSQNFEVSDLDISSNNSVFDNFDFLDISVDNDRKNNDVETIDLDF